MVCEFGWFRNVWFRFKWLPVWFAWTCGLVLLLWWLVSWFRWVLGLGFVGCWCSVCCLDVVVGFCYVV